MAETPVENRPSTKPAIGVTVSGEPTGRRLHVGKESTGGSFNKMLRRRHKSTDSPRELLREEKAAKQKLKDDLSRLATKVRQLKAVLAKRGLSSPGGDGGGPRPARGDRGSRCDDWDEALDSASHFLLVSLAALLALWLAVNLFRCLAVYLLPELFLECVVAPGPVASSSLSDWRARTALARQLLAGRHPCQPVHLKPQCE